MESPHNTTPCPQVGIVGAGPAGLIAADLLSQAGCKVQIFDQMPSAGRKFLIASKGGLNLTHSMPFPDFLARYRDDAAILQPYLEPFGPAELVQWINELGFPTFTGTSGRIFPESMNGGAILHALLKRIQAHGGQFFFEHQLSDWKADGSLRFHHLSNLVEKRFDAVLFALGGASWPQTGSDAGWVELFQKRDIPISPFKPSNCGFTHEWSPIFAQRYAGQPLKPLQLSFRGSSGQKFEQSGELLITDYGVEGSLIYACSALLREEIEQTGMATIMLDLLPQWSEQQVIHKLARDRGKQTFSNFLRKSIGLEGVRTGLLFELLEPARLRDPLQLAMILKQLPLTLAAPRPLSEAISSAGGVKFTALNHDLMIKSQPGFFCAGEMLDWEAPTGGFLLTASFSTGHAAAKGILTFLSSRRKQI